VHFDLRGEDDSSLPLLRSHEAQQIARELLFLVAELDDEALDAGALIERVLAAEPADADAVLAEVAAVEDRAPAFAALAEQLTRGFLLCVVLPDVGRRRVIKFAYDEPLGRPDQEVHFYDAPGCTEAASYHVEIAVPDEMRARRTQLVDDRTGAVLAVGPRDADRPAVRYSAEPGVRMHAGVSVHYGLERGRFLVPAALVAWVIALELSLPLLFADLGALAASGGPAIAVLLSSTAVFSALVLRSGEHPLVRLVLAPYRLCLAAATIAAVVAGAVLAFRAASTTLDIAWGAGAVVAVLAAGILTGEAAHAPAAAKDP
jgi:hypothetical protein